MSVRPNEIFYHCSVNIDNTLQLTHESLKNPIHVKTQFVFKDYDEQRRIEQQAKRNARIG
jgi:hypothetical protein